MPSSHYQGCSHPPAWVLGWKYKIGPDSPRSAVNTNRSCYADEASVWMRAQVFEERSCSLLGLVFFLLFLVLALPASVSNVQCVQYARMPGRS